MNVSLVVVFYHPKDPKNVADIAEIVYDVNAQLLIIPRGGVNYDIEVLRFRYDIVKIVGMYEAINAISNCMRILLETYGNVLIHELPFKCNGCIALILGAEDYGIPKHVSELFKPHAIARIPTRAEGMSYNVVVSAVMAIYEVLRRCKE